MCRYLLFMLLFLLMSTSSYANDVYHFNITDHNRDSIGNATFTYSPLTQTGTYVANVGSGEDEGRCEKVNETPSEHSYFCHSAEDDGARGWIYLINGVGWIWVEELSGSWGYLEVVGP